MLPDSPYGITKGLFHSNKSLATDIVAWSLDLGFTWFRLQINIDLVWLNQNDAPANWNWYPLDASIQLLQQNGFFINFPIRNLPSWALSQQTCRCTDATQVFYQADPAAYNKVATAVAQRYNGTADCISTNPSGASINYGKLTIHAIEIGNEEYNLHYTPAGNVPPIFGIYNSPYKSYNALNGVGLPPQPSRDPHFWIPVAKLATPSIRNNSNAKVGMCAVWWKDTGNYTDFMSGVYAEGGKGLFDYANLHHYSNNKDPITFSPSLPDGINNMHAVMKTNGDGAVPIWYTEFGWGVTSDGNAQFQSDNYTKVYDWCRSSSGGVVQKAFMFTLDDQKPVLDDKSVMQWGYGQATATSYVKLPAYTTIKNYIIAHPTWGVSQPPPNTHTLGVVNRSKFTINESGTTGGGTPNVMLIAMENRAYSEITASSSAWTNVKKLMSTYANLTKFYATDHPSLPNYLAFMSGSDQGVTADGTPASVGGPFAGNTFLDVLSSATPAIPWNTYFESIPSTGYTGPDTGNYAQRHNPFVYFTTFLNNSTKVNKLVGYTQSKLISDLNGSNPPNFVWITPNTSDDGHTPNTDDTTPDTFIGNIIPAVQATNWYKNNGTIIVWWDESHPDNANDPGIGNANPGGGQTGCIVISNFTKGYGSYTTPVNHFGILHTLSTLYGVSPLKNASNPANGNIDPLFTTGGNPPPTTFTLVGRAREKFSIRGVAGTHPLGVQPRAPFKIAKSLEIDPVVKFSIADRPLLQALMIFPGRNGTQPMKGRDGVVSIKGRDGVFSFKGRNGKSISFKGRGSNR